MTIPSDLFSRIRTTLLTCWSYESDYHLNALFLDPRLYPWRHSVPQASSKAGNVNVLISYLHDKKHSENGRNALVLLLEVLAEQLDPGDSCVLQLQELGRELETAVARPAPSPGAVQTKPDRKQLLQLLTTHFSEEELRDLCFYLDDVDFDSLPGQGKSAKARELVLFLERRNKLHMLLEAGRSARPDVAWD
jgi:hypothetical protein